MTINIKCCEHRCIANFNGACVVKECKGVLTTNRDLKHIGKDARRKLYASSMKMFEENFKEV